MKNIKTIYNRMYARTIYISAAAVLALGSLASCSNDDDATSPTDDENTPISATASVASATGSVSRGFADGSGLSGLTLWYVADGATDAYTDFTVPDGYITDATSTDFNFTTGNKEDDADNKNTPHLFWQKVNADKTLYLTVKRQESDMAIADELWAIGTQKEADGKRGPLTFNLKSRYAKFTLEVNANQPLKENLFTATISTYPAAATDDMTALAKPKGEWGNTTTTVISNQGSGEVSTKSGTIYVVPQAMDGNNKTLTLTYNGTDYTVDLSTVTVTRLSGSVYDPANTGAWPYNTTSPNTPKPNDDGFQRFNADANTFAFNANEHITLTVTLTLSTTLTPGNVTVTGFAEEAEDKYDDFDGTYTTNN